MFEGFGGGRGGGNMCRPKQAVEFPQVVPG